MPTPPASAMSQRPAHSASQATHTATSEVEQALCTAMLGPVKLSLYEHVRRQVVLVVEQQDLHVVDMPPRAPGCCRC